MIKDVNKFLEGHIAFGRGLRLSACPYSNEAEMMSWQEGYNHAKQNALIYLQQVKNMLL